MTARVFEGERLDPKLHYLAVRRIGAGSVARHPQRLGKRDVGSSRTCFPKGLVGSKQRSGERPPEQHPNQAGTQESHARQLSTSGPLAQAEKTVGEEDATPELVGLVTETFCRDALEVGARLAGDALVRIAEPHLAAFENRAVEHASRQVGPRTRRMVA